MIKQFYVLLLVFSGLFFISTIHSEEKDNKLIKVTKVNGRAYYHIEFVLNSGNFRLNTKYGFKEGGIFELFIPKTAFPVPAPNCKKDIILRMPWTDETKKHAAQYIKEKKVLYDRLSNIGDRKIEVIIELNPYIMILDDNQNNVELSRCNVFFRHSGGRYIPNL